MEDLSMYWEVTGLLEARYEEVSGYDFYQEIFPDGECSTEQHMDFSHPNAIFLCYDEKKGYKVRYPMYRDTWEKDYMELIESKENCVCGGLAYRQRRNLLRNAQQMNALIFDLDGVGQHELLNLLHRFQLKAGTLRSLPTPTFLVASGTGVHLYYVLEEPVDLFPNIKLQLKSMKHDLTFKIWEYKATSRVKSIQYQSINQGFRMVGSVNEKHGVELRAFRTGDRISIAELNRYVIDPKNQVDLQKRFRPSKMTREEAKLTYPEWYQRVVVEGNKKAKKWDIAGKVNGDDPYALYHWWLRQIDEVKGGHRYFFLMCMAIYASKCDVPKSKLKEDLEAAYKILQGVEHTNPMKREDIKSALEAYSKEYYNFLIEDIERLTEIRIERNKRNGRKRTQHIKIMSAVRDVLHPDGEWRKGNGRPKGSGTAQEKVAAYRAEHPDANVTEVARALQISRTTAYKWWNGQPETEPVSDKPTEEEPADVFYRFVPGGIERVDPEQELRRAYRSEALKAAKRYNWKKP